MAQTTLILGVMAWDACQLMQTSSPASLRGQASLVAVLKVTRELRNQLCMLSEDQTQQRNGASSGGARAREGAHRWAQSGWGGCRRRARTRA